MRILLNFSSIRKGGGIQVALSLAEQLRKYSDISWGIIYNESIEQPLLKCDLSGVKLFKVLTHPLKQRFSFLRSMRRFESEFSPDVVFSLFGPSYWTPKTKHLEGFAIPHFVFPDSPYFTMIGFRLKLFHLISKLVKTFFLKREADYWVVENNAIEANLAKLLKVDSRRIFTVYNTSHQIFDEELKWQPISLTPKASDVLRLVCISAYYPHKHLEIIPKVLGQMNELFPFFKVEIVTTLPEHIYQRLNVSKKINWINTGPIKVEQCPSLYKQCDALFLPTLLESFSASYVEAMKMGIPIVTTDLPFAHSICSEAALYFDPLSAQSAAETINLLRDKNMRQSLIASGQERVKEFGTAKTRIDSYIFLLRKLFLTHV